MINHKDQIWASSRAILETEYLKSKRSGKRSKSKYRVFNFLLNIFMFIVKIIGLYNRGLINTRNIDVKHIDLNFDCLPASFNGFRILQLSDLHVDCLPEMESIIIDKINEQDFDLCVMTGDYKMKLHGSFDNIIKPISRIAKAANRGETPIAILGNHDSFLMVETEKDMGIKFLVNKTITINKKKDKIYITGTDDPFRYFSDEAIQALEEKLDGFKIALVHTTELSDLASENHYDLYLCGHTHGGQICLPGGVPLMTRQGGGNKNYKGHWKINGMDGYTSKGCGVSGIPLRYNCPGEITIFSLFKIDKFEFN